MRTLARIVVDTNVLVSRLILPQSVPADAVRRAELEGRLAKGGTISFKVSEKGAVSVYGLGRFPVTLYLEQWDALLSHASPEFPRF